ncbi:hypothetical protein [Vagococcus sp. WN89Y]|uniref:hypothetical protein n=1 Tax=Vagococcus sp. WN89Y TaxID=3457258 RepID=UPI003FCCF45A
MQNSITSFEPAETPLVNSLKQIYQRQIYSFHALPISSFGKSDILPFNKEQDICLESTITDEAFDSFFFPARVINESQKLTAKIYNADNTFYITGGTSVANQIAITALFDKNENILIDRNCHQSIHFHCQALGAKVDYLCPDLNAEDGQLKAWSIENLTTKILSKQSAGQGYGLIILTAQSYEGLIYDIPSVLLHLLEKGVRTRKFFIDEAWGSLNYFSEDTQPYTVMNVDSIIQQYPDLEIICTHSAHKSLFCLRQASLIHCKGKPDLFQKIEVAKFKIHTTSPNYSILASLDRAQYYLRQYGNEMASYSRKLVSTFVEMIKSDANLSLIDTEFSVFQDQPHIHHDPTKLIINVKPLGDPFIIKEKLLRQNIFIKRVLNKCLLLNFHSGINKEAVNALFNALLSLSKCTAISEEFKVNSISDKFIIPYPPGVPIAFPGDTINASITQKIRDCEEKGLLIIAA